MDNLNQHIRSLTADRHSPEARALYMALLKYIQGRVKNVTRNRASGMFSVAEKEDIVADVLLQLMTGSLVQFRGETIPELYAYVRTITDRRIWRVMGRRIKERDLLRRSQIVAEVFQNRSQEGPDKGVEMDPEVPLSEEDEGYLTALLRAGSKAEFARQNTLSRAAVTQRVKRIMKRIESLTVADQLAVEVWLNKTARQVVGEQSLESLVS